MCPCRTLGECTAPERPAQTSAQAGACTWKERSAQENEGKVSGSRLLQLHTLSFCNLLTLFTFADEDERELALEVTCLSHMQCLVYSTAVTRCVSLDRFSNANQRSWVLVERLKKRGNLKRLQRKSDLRPQRKQVQVIHRTCVHSSPFHLHVSHGQITREFQASSAGC